MVFIFRNVELTNLVKTSRTAVPKTAKIYIINISKLFREIINNNPDNNGYLDISYFKTFLVIAIFKIQTGSHTSLFWKYYSTKQNEKTYTNQLRIWTFVKIHQLHCWQ